MTIDSVPALILALGGEVAVARNLIVHASELRRWIDTGWIPNGWHLRLYLAARQQGHEIDLRLFELADWRWRI